jgi:predicted outer membrane repeat protein
MDGPAKLTSLLFQGNVAQEGGGVLCFGSEVVLEGCAFTANQAQRGAGLFCDDGDSCVAKNCRFAGNLAREQGGGISCRKDSAPLFVTCTIAENRAPEGESWLQVEDSRPTLENCIAWGNGGSPQPAGNSEVRVTSSCLEGDVVFPGEGNLNRDPLFLANGRWDDGGTTDDLLDDVWAPGDYHLQPGSPCIDAGTPEGAPPSDLDGHGRPCGKGVDMGAFESGDCPFPVPFRRGDASADGSIDIADAVFTLSALFQGGLQPTCLDAEDANDDGNLDITDAVFLLSYLFLGGKPPSEPLGICGVDPTQDDLTCLGFSACP